MEELFTVQNLISLFTLTLLEVVLGIDNVIFVSIIIGRLHRGQQARARRLWMITGIMVRIILLFCLSWLISQRGKPVFTLFDKGFDLASLVMLGGGLFLLYKTVQEIHGKLEGDEHEFEQKATNQVKGFGNAIVQIIFIDMIFSFDSMITAVGIANVLPVMITAVCIAMVIMFLFSQKIADFIARRPTFKMLALSFLVLVSFVLLVEGWNAERAHELHLKNYVYFAMAFSFGVEILNQRMLKKRRKPVELRGPHEIPADQSDSAH
ncbi:MAG: TerC family protein [Chitinophagaceae bacterium]|nr:MAG: TerC family protein [Chitinophagaceae bacterium]